MRRNKIYYGLRLSLYKSGQRRTGSAFYSFSTSTSHSSIASCLLQDVAKAVPNLFEFQTQPNIWCAATVSDGWEKAYELIREFHEDPTRVNEIEEHDVKGLAMCTAHLEFQCLLRVLPFELGKSIEEHPDFSMETVEEIFLHLGQRIEVRGKGWLIQLPPPSEVQLKHILDRVGEVGDDGRANVSSTSHRVSVWRARNKQVLGVTIRVGRYLPGVARALIPLARRGSILILAKAGMGKTTLIRDISASLANNYVNGSEEDGARRVVVVDSSNEICGDGQAPLPFLARCRRMQVPKGSDQSQVMAEVVQNHTPEYLVVGEILSKQEAEAVWSTSQRGVRMLATCHGESLEGLVNNQTLKLLVGGSEHAFLSNEERRMRNKKKKTILERPFNSPFDYVVEMITRETAYIYFDVNKAVDLLLDDKNSKNEAVVCKVVLRDPLPSAILEHLMNSNNSHEKPKSISSASSTGSFRSGSSDW